MERDNKKEFLKKVKIYFSREIAIEYKACLYAFCITVFYCACLLCQGIFQAQIGHMCQFFILAYLVGYLQVYLLRNFDEAERLGIWEAGSMLFCDCLYTACSYMFGWFGRQLWATGLFFLYMLAVYGCVFLINRLKRNIDTENLNQMLVEYKRKQYGDFAYVENIKPDGQEGWTDGTARGQADGTTRGQADGTTRGQTDGTAKGQTEERQ